MYNWPEEFKSTGTGKGFAGNEIDGDEKEIGDNDNESWLEKSMLLVLFCGFSKGSTGIFLLFVFDAFLSFGKSVS